MRLSHFIIISLIICSFFEANSQITILDCQTEKKLSSENRKSTCSIANTGYGNSSDFCVDCTPIDFSCGSTRLPLNVVFFKREDGSSILTQNTIEDLVEEVNDYYASVGIEFYIPIGNIMCEDDMNFYDECNDLSNLQSYINNGYINVFIHYCSGYPSGIAFEIGGDSFTDQALVIRPWVDQDFISGLPGMFEYNVELLAHELGHVLGLYHTHSIAFGNDPSQDSCTEYDAVEDTNYDEEPTYSGSPGVLSPDTYTIDPCNYTGDISPEPLLTNIMSYYRGCRNDFSACQATKMMDVVCNCKQVLCQKPDVPKVYLGNSPTTEVSSLSYTFGETLDNLITLLTGSNRSNNGNCVEWSFSGPCDINIQLIGSEFDLNDLYDSGDICSQANCETYVLSVSDRTKYNDQCVSDPNTIEIEICPEVDCDFEVTINTQECSDENINLWDMNFNFEDLNSNGTYTFQNTAINNGSIYSINEGQNYTISGIVGQNISFQLTRTIPTPICSQNFVYSYPEELNCLDEEDCLDQNSISVVSVCNENGTNFYYVNVTFSGNNENYTIVAEDGNSSVVSQVFGNPNQSPIAVPNIPSGTPVTIYVYDNIDNCPAISAEAPVRYCSMGDINPMIGDDDCYDGNGSMVISWTVTTGNSVNIEACPVGNSPPCYTIVSNTSDSGGPLLWNPQDLDGSGFSFPGDYVIKIYDPNDPSLNFSEPFTVANDCSDNVVSDGIQIDLDPSCNVIGDIVSAGSSTLDIVWELCTCDGTSCLVIVNPNPAGTAFNWEFGQLEDGSFATPGCYFIKAYDFNDNSNVATGSTFNLQETCDDCNAPTSLSFNGTGVGSGNLSWNAVNNADSYILELSTDNGVTWNLLSSNWTMNSISLSPLPSCQSLDMRVATNCSDGQTSDFTSISFLTDGCEGPDGSNGSSGNSSAAIGDCPGDDEDDEAPIFINCPSNVYTFYIDNSDNCEAAVNWSVPVAVDNCNVTVTNISGINPGDSMPQGNYFITYIAEDNNGNDVSCDFQVIVLDGETLEFQNCPSTLQFNLVPDECTAYTNWSIPAATDNCAVTVSHISGPTPGSQLEVGTYTVVYEAVNNDSPQETVTCTFTVEVIDNQELEFINCPTAPLVFGSDPDQCDVFANWSIPVATDNCDVVISHVSGPEPGDELVPGTYTVIYQATNNDNPPASVTCTFDIIVNETQNPELNCPQDVTVANDVGVCEAAVPNIQLEFAFDNCPFEVTWVSAPTDVTGTGTSTSSNASGAIFPVGITTVTYTITELDDQGNGIQLATCDIIVTVIDEEPPMITCPADATIGTSMGGVGDCQGEYTWTHPTPTDNCAVTVYDITYTNPDGSLEGPTDLLGMEGVSITRIFDLGLTTMLYHVEDEEGNITECTFTVLVEDDEDPMIFCEENVATNVYCIDETLDIEPNDISSIILNVAPSMTITDVNITQLAGTQPDMGALTVTLTSPAGTTITLFSGLCPGTPDFDLSLDDASAPAIASAGCTPLGGTTDWMPQDPLATFNGENSAGDWILTFDNSHVGLCGELTDWKLEIIGNDNSANGNRLQLVADPGTCTYKMSELDFDPRFEDNCPDAYIRHNAIMGPFDHTLQGAVFPLGETIVTWTVYDQAGNTASCDMIIEILDTEAPEFTNCPMPDIIQNAETDECSAYVTFSQPLAIDNCDDVTVTQIDNTGLNSGSVFPVGMTIMTWEAVDGSGNTAQCSLRVIVNDTQQPLMECPDDVVENMDPWQCSAIVNNIGPTVIIDNCMDNVAVVYQVEYPQGSGDFVSGGVVNASGEEFLGGISEVTYKLSDQPLLLLTEVTHEIGITNGGMDPVPPYAVLTTDDYVEVTNFGPAALDISGVKIERLNVVLPEIFCVPDGTIIPVGQTMVVHFGNGTDDPANLFFNVPCAIDMTTGMGAAYVMSFNGRVIDVVAVNGYAPIGGGTIAVVGSADWTGAIASMAGKGGVIREFSFDNSQAFDWIIADVCYPLTIGTVNPDLQIIPDNGTTTAMQSIMPNMVTCSFTVEVLDQELPYCGEFEEHIYDGATNLSQANSIVGGSVFSSIINVPDDFRIGDVDLLDVIGQHPEMSGLTFKLTSPEGTEVILFDGLCLGTADFDLSLDSDSLISVNNAPCDPLGQGAFFAPVTDLCEVNQAFFGESSLGDWIFEIADSTALNSGQLDNWELRLWEIQPYSQQDTIYGNDPGDCGADFTWVHPRLIDNCKGCDGGTVELKYVTEDDIMLPTTPGFITEADTITEFFEVGTTTVRYILTDPSGNVDSCEFDVTILDIEDPFVQCPNDIIIQLRGGECREFVCFEPLLTTDNCAVVDTTYSVEPCTYFEIGITPIEIVVFDPAGNTDTCEFNIIVNEYIPDTEALVCNDHIYLSLDPNCEAEIGADMLFEGNEYHCYEDYIVVLIDEQQDTIPTGATVTQAYEGQTLTYSVTDPETGNVCWGLITIEEKLIPEIECPPNTSILCSANKDKLDEFGMLVTGEMSIMSCETGVNTYYEDVIVYYEECESLIATINRTFYLIDDEENEVSCTQLIDILPFDFSQITWPPDVVLDCDSVAINPLLTIPDSTGYPMIGDTLMLNANAICNFTHSMIDEQFWFCGNSYEIVRTWKIRNRCQPLSATNPIIHEQLVEVLDNTPPVMHECPSDIVLSVNPWTCAGSGYLPVPEVIFDSCADHVMFEANIYGGGFLDITGSLAENNLSIYVSNINKGTTSTVVYGAYDDCGNRTDCSFTITVVDDTPPTAITKENIVVSLTSGGTNDDGTAKIFAESIDNGSHDGSCGMTRLEIRRPGGAPQCDNDGINGYNNNITFTNAAITQTDNNNSDTDGGQYVKFCCEDLVNADTYIDAEGNSISYADSLAVILRVWDDGNCDGIVGGAGDNFSESWTYVQLENKLPPVIYCPPDATIGCDADWTLHSDHAVATVQEYNLLTSPDFGTGVASASGICGVQSVTYRDNYNEDLCFIANNEITRTWCIENTDICCTQRIDIVGIDDFDPNTISLGTSGMVVTNPPLDITLACIDESVLPLEPTWLAAPCESIGWSMESDTFMIEGDACIKIENEYTVANWCTDEEWSFTQFIKVIDDNKPELIIDSLCVEVNTTCQALPGEIQLTAIATDSSSVGHCVSPWLKWQVSIDLYGDWTYDHVFSSYVSPQDSNFGTGPNEYYITPTAPGDQISLTIPTTVSSSKYEHRVLWTVSDGCGNTTSYTSTFLVTDKKAPTPYCNSVSSSLMQGSSPMVELWACDFVISATDNCTSSDNLRYTFSEIPPSDDPDYDDSTQCSTKSFSCEDLDGENSGVIYLEIYTWDECDNFDVCIVELTLNGACNGQIETARIAGNVQTEQGGKLENVVITINSNQPEYPMSMLTDENGEYSSQDHSYYQNYQTSAYFSDNPRNGVSTLDIIYIQRHILNIQSLTSGYKYIAADVNNDQKITAADIIDVRKLILEVTNDFPNNDSWRFTDATQVISTDNAFAFNEVLYVTTLYTDMLSENLIGIKIGDVNGSATVNAIYLDTESRSDKTLNLSYTTRQEDSKIYYDFTSSNFKDILGFQFTVDIGELELSSIESNALNITDDNVGLIDKHTLTFSWNTAIALDIEDDVLFTIELMGSSYDQPIVVNSAITNAEAYDSELNILDIQVDNDIENQFALYQNNPNPFTEFTTIDFYLPESGNATIKVLDVTGKVIFNQSDNYKKGRNTFKFNKENVGSAGLLYYSLEFNGNTAIKKMILIE